MKKLITLFAAAVMAVGAYAKEVVNLAKFNNGDVSFQAAWNMAIADVFTGSFTGTEAPITDENVTYFDASSYDYVIFKYSTSEIGAGLQSVIRYTTDGGFKYGGPTFNETKVSFRPYLNGGILAAPLDADQKNKVASVCLQAFGPGSITLTEVYFATKSEYEAAMEAVKNNNKTCYLAYNDTKNLKAGDEGWDNGGLWFGEPGFDVSAYSKAIITVASAEGNCDIVFGCDDGYKGLSFTASTSESVQEIDLSNSNNLIQIGVVNKNYPEGSTNKAEILANTVVIKSITLVDATTTKIENIESSTLTNEVLYNMSGQKVGKNYKGLVINKATGKKFINK